jgi:hypothetical protein
LDLLKKRKLFVVVDLAVDSSMLHLRREIHRVLPKERKNRREKSVVEVDLGS